MKLWRYYVDYAVPQRQSFSKSDAMHEIVTWLYIIQYNLALVLTTTQSKNKEPSGLPLGSLFFGKDTYTGLYSAALFHYYADFFFELVSFLFEGGKFF